MPARITIGGSHVPGQLPGEGIDDADTLEGAREIDRSGRQSRDDVDEIRSDRFPSGHSSRPWGRMIRQSDGG